MTIKKLKVKDGPLFCFGCGRQLDKERYEMSFGNPASTDDFCRACLQKIYNRAGKALSTAKRKAAK